VLVICTKDHLPQWQDQPEPLVVSLHHQRMARISSCRTAKNFCMLHRLQHGQARMGTFGPFSNRSWSSVYDLAMHNHTLGGCTAHESSTVRLMMQTPCSAHSKTPNSCARKVSGSVSGLAIHVGRPKRIPKSVNMAVKRSSNVGWLYMSGTYCDDK
jgi:hypothetical protein